jgi:hypothetical protein
MALGLCKRCYNVRYHHMIRKGATKNVGSLYPQALVRVPVSGWGARVISRRCDAPINIVVETDR